VGSAFRRTNPAEAGSHKWRSAHHITFRPANVWADAPFARLVIISTVGVLLHILMDLPTSYGTRLLSPFSWRWYAMDLMPIIDVYLWMILAAGLLAGSWRPRARQRSAAIALALMAGNYGIRVAAHQEALAAAAQVYGPTLPAPCDPSAAFGSLLDSWPQAGGSSCLVDTAAMPSFGSPFEWRVIAQLPGEYVEISGNDAARIANHWTPQVSAAARTRTAQVLLGFSRFPVAWEIARPSGGATVQFTDLRFAMGLANRPPQAGRSALFTVTVTVGPDNEILKERLGE
jgi:inner membrane protein